MGDIVMAYDRTVRNAYGDQLIQFSYVVLKEKSFTHDSSDGSFNENIDAFDPIGGHPIGALAACALFEAAYSALDQPISILETSPLLTFKMLLLILYRKHWRVVQEKAKDASLYLSDKLRRLRYGFEYGALEVKNHLKKLLFSDIVSTLITVYSSNSPQNCQAYTCPWVFHFRLCKDIVNRRRLKVISITDALSKCCEALPSLVNVQIASKSGCLADVRNESRNTLCITVTISESLKRSCTDLHSVHSCNIS